MKRRIIVTLSMAACIVLVGCGSSIDPNAADNAPAEYTETPAASAEEDTTPGIPMEDFSSEQLDEQATTENFGQVPEEDTIPWDETAENEQPFEEEITTQDDAMNEVKGIVVVNSYYQPASDGKGNNFIYDVHSVDPDSGIATHIARFAYYQPYNNEYSFFPLVIGARSYTGYDRRLFSSDLTKMAVTINYAENGKMHAGWIDQDGNFFDVIDAVGESSGDFDDVVKYAAVGFTDNDCFVYNDDAGISSADWEKVNFRYVDISHPTESYEGNPLSDYNPIHCGSDLYFISDANNTDCIVNYQDGYKSCKSLKYNATTQETVEYIPGSSRINWGGVISPDGSQIAFLSMPKEGSGSPEIYVMPFEGGDPVKVECDLSLGRDFITTPCTLLYWK